MVSISPLPALIWLRNAREHATGTQRTRIDGMIATLGGNP